MADDAGTTLAGVKLGAETGNFFHKVYYAHGTINNLRTMIQNGKDEILRAIHNLRGHRGISTTVLHSQTKALINALRYSKWPGDLDSAILVNKKSPDNNADLLDRIAYLVYVIPTPYQDREIEEGKDTLSLGSKIAIQFTQNRWKDVIGILDNTKKALDAEVQAAITRLAVGTTVKKELSSAVPPESPGALILQRAGKTPNVYKDIAQAQIRVLSNGSSGRNILFYGVAGCGKSTKAIALHNYLKEAGTKTSIFIHTHLRTHSTYHAILTDMAAQLMNSIDTNAVSPETMQLWNTSSSSPPYSIPLLQAFISDVLVDNAIDIIVDEVSDCSTDQLYLFCQEMLELHPQLRLIRFTRRNGEHVDNAGATGCFLVVPDETGVKSILEYSIRVCPGLKRYESEILQFLNKYCCNSYRIMYAVLFKLCSSSFLEVEQYLATPEFDKGYVKKIRDALHAIAKSSRLDLIVLVLLSFERSISKIEVLRLAVDINNYWPGVPARVACSLSSLPSDDFWAQFQVTATNLGKFLTENNGCVFLKDPCVMGVILDFTLEHHYDFVRLFPRAFVEGGYLEARECTHIAQKVALVYPDSCTHFQYYVTGRADLVGMLKETVPAAYDSDPWAYLPSLARNDLESV